MKKQLYVQPMTVVVMVNNSTPLLAGSELGVGNGTMDAGNALSRQGGSFWDDEDE